MKTNKNILIFACLLMIYSCSDDDPMSSSPSCNDGIQNGNELGVDCGGDCSDCLSSENDILNIIFEDGPADFLAPIVDIDNPNNRVYISIGKVFPTTDITDLNFDIEVSAGASVGNIPTDFSEPQTISVIAEDGNIKNYQFIVTGAYGTFTVVTDVSSFAGETRAIYQVTRAGQFDNKVEIFLSADLNIVSDFYYYAFVARLNNKSLNNSLVGEYDISGSNPDDNFSSFSFKDGSSTIGLWWPTNGRLVITDHDLENKLISGQILDMCFASIPGSDEQHYPYAEFINVRYD